MRVETSLFKAPPLLTFRPLNNLQIKKSSDKKMNEILTALLAQFPQGLFDFIPIEGDWVYVEVFYGTADKSLCMKFTVSVKEKQAHLMGLKIPHNQCVHCKYTGAELLLKLYLIVKQLGIETVELSDESEKYFAEDCRVSLTVLSILQYGMTWYNRFGYYGPNRYAEHAFIQRELHRPFSEWNWNSLTDKLARAFKRIPYLPARLKYRGNYTLDEFKHELKSEGFENVDTLHDIGKLLQKRLKSDDFCKSPLYFILRHLEHRIFNGRIATELKLTVNNPDTGSIYSALEKKIGSQGTTGGKMTRHKRPRKRSHRFSLAA